MASSCSFSSAVTPHNIGKLPDSGSNKLSLSNLSFSDKYWNVVTSSRLLWGITILASATIVTAILLSPPSWVVIAMAIGTVTLPVIGMKALKNIDQKGDFELTAFMNLFRNNFNSIKIGGEDTQIYLGSMPNQIGNHGKFLKEMGVEAVLSCLESWEATDSNGFAQPYTNDEWKGLGINFMNISIEDHTLMSPSQMNEAADFIAGELQKGVKVYVHCRAGVGRSATAIAAYLIKYQKMGLEDAIKTIKNSRPKSTIKSKILSLIAFSKSLDPTYSVASIEETERALGKLKEKERRGKTTTAEKEILSMLDPK